MNAGKHRASGFTLVEILIVVVILGILAAIVIPQFTSASESARASSLASQLQTIRSQLELYQVQHSADYPTLTGADWSDMTEETADGYGPYLQQAPRNPFSPDEGADGGISVGGYDDTTVAWAYDDTNGQIRAVVSGNAQEAVEEAGLRETDDYVVVADGG